MAKQLDTKLEQLLLQKAYHQLTPKEEAFVLTCIDANVYQSMRQSLLNAKSVFNQSIPAPRPMAKAKFQAALAKRQPENAIASFMTGLMEYKIPAWQVAMSLTMVCLYFLFPWSKTIQNNLEGSTIVYKSDTIFNVQPQIINTTNPKEVEPDSQAVAPKTLKANVIDTMQQMVENIQAVFPDTNQLLLMVKDRPQYALNDSAHLRSDSFGIKHADTPNIWARPRIY